MSDADRKAFLEWASSMNYSNATVGSDAMQSMWTAWCYARDRYAPKLTEKEAVEIIRQSGYGPANKIGMLKAAGMRFKEGARANIRISTLPTRPVTTPKKTVPASATVTMASSQLLSAETNGSAANRMPSTTNIGQRHDRHPAASLIPHLKLPD